MRKRFYNFGPAIFLFSGMLLPLTALFLLNDKNLAANMHLAWPLLFLFQMIIIIIGCCLIIRLEKLVRTDSLTGLNNRRYFYEKLASLQEDTPLSLLFIDIDNFKSVNDTYGHLTGDQILQQMANILRINTRKNDTVSRWGGEEFALILPKTDAKEAYVIADRIRELVGKHEFTDNGATFRITVSIGIATTEKKAMKILEEDLIRTADDALKKAKEQKNTVKFFAEGF